MPQELILMGCAVRKIFVTVAGAALGLAALASGSARADLIIGCSGQTGCAANLASINNNTFVNYGPHALGMFSVNLITITGSSDLSAPELQDDGTLSISSNTCGTHCNYPQSITFDLDSDQHQWDGIKEFRVDLQLRIDFTRYDRHADLLARSDE